MSGGVSGDVTLLGLLGAGLGIGLVLVRTGWRGRPAAPKAGGTGRRPDRFVEPRVNGFVDMLAGRGAGSADGWPLGRPVRVAVVAVAAGVLAAVITGWVVGGVLAATAAATLPRLLGPDRRGGRSLARVEAVATWTEMLRDTLSAAAGLEQTIVAAAGAAPAALGEEIRGLATRLQRGDRLPAALRQFADEVADPTCDLVVAALVLAAEHQARQLADLLGELAREAREQVAMRLRVDAGRSSTRTSVRVIVGTTLTFAAGLVLLNRAYLQPYDSAGGQLILLIIGALFALAFGWLARIGRIEEAGRVLTNPGMATSLATAGGAVESGPVTRGTIRGARR